MNQDYSHWKRQDKFVFSALLGAISPTIQPLLSRATTAYQIWETLESTYAKPTRSHIKQLRQQIKEWKKGNKTIDDYMQGFITRFDQLAILGKAYDLEDQVEFIIDGLPEEYKNVVDQIESKDITPSLIEIHERLINQEAKLQSANPQPASAIIPVSANVATHRGNNNNTTQRGNSRNRQYSNRNNTRNNNWQYPNNNNRADTYQPRPYLGRCQLCGQQGHSARRCNQLNNTSRSNNSVTGQQSPFTPWQPRANVAMAPQYTANNWLLDSGATHHITSDLANLSLHQPYAGNEEVLIGDGSGLAISHTGSTLLPSQHRPLSLNNILCVPNIHKNLISVYRLCNSNQVSVEFFPAHFQVKDLSSGVPLLQGRTKDELYEWPVTRSNIHSLLASTSPKTSSHKWHSRLGHPSFSVLQSVASQFALPMSSSSKHLSCTHCLINKSHKLPFAQSSITSSRPLQYVFSDVWSSPITSVENHKYYLVLVDHYTRYTWLYPLSKKSQVRDVFIAYKALVEKQFQTPLTTLYSDNGGEFIALRSLLDRTWHCSPHYTTTYAGAQRAFRKETQTRGRNRHDANVSSWYPKNVLALCLRRSSLSHQSSSHSNPINGISLPEAVPQEAELQQSQSFWLYVLPMAATLQYS